MTRHQSMSDFKVEASHPVKIQELGRVVGISQEFMGLYHICSNRRSLTAMLITVYRNPSPGLSEKSKS